MPGLDCLLVADDLTGACDAAVHFAICGLRPATVLVTRGTYAGDARVVAISTESRDLGPSEIRSALAEIAKEFPAGSAAHVFKKIDSTLRGNTGLEVGAALDLFACDAAVVCPAFPAVGRVVEDGFLRLAGRPEFRPIDVRARLEDQAGLSCLRTRPEDLGAALAAGGSLVSVDANCDPELDCIAAIILATGRRILWAGSGGLAAALARRIGQEGTAPPPPPARRGGVLFCIGSDHAVTCDQQAAMLAARDAVLLYAPVASRSTIGEALSAGRHVILRIPRGQIADWEVRERIGGILPAAMVISGGDTTSLVCRAIGVQRIELCDEIVAGVPRGILHGGECDSVPAATKSGGFGPTDTLIQVADYFACADRAWRADLPSR